MIFLLGCKPNAQRCLLWQLMALLRWWDVFCAHWCSVVPATSRWRRSFSLVPADMTLFCIGPFEIFARHSFLLRQVVPVRLRLKCDSTDMIRLHGRTTRVQVLPSSTSASIEVTADFYNVLWMQTMTPLDHIGSRANCKPHNCEHAHFFPSRTFKHSLLQRFSAVIARYVWFE